MILEKDIKNYKGWYFNRPTSSFRGHSPETTLKMLGPKLFSTFKAKLCTAELKMEQFKIPETYELVNLLRAMKNKNETILRLETDDGKSIIIGFLYPEVEDTHNQYDYECNVIVEVTDNSGLSYINGYAINLDIYEDEDEAKEPFVIMPGFFHNNGVDYPRFIGMVNQYYESRKWENSLGYAYYALNEYLNNHMEKTYPNNSRLEIELYKDLVGNFYDSPYRWMWKQYNKEEV